MMFWRNVLTVLLIFFACTVCAEARLEDKVWSLKQAELFDAPSSKAIPLEQKGWQATTLPFSQAGSKAKGYLWFRFDIDSTAQKQPQALYIHSHVFDLDIYLNGERIGGRSLSDGRQAMAWNHPFYMDLPSALWKQQGNRFYLRLGLGEPNAILSPLWFGDADRLKAQWESRYFQQVEVAKWSLIACVLMGFFTFCIWLMRRADTLYLYFSLICTSWSMVMTYLVLPYAPIEHSTWLSIGYFAVDVSAFFTFVFINRLMSFDHQKLERILLVLLLLSGLVIALMDMQDHVKVMATTHGLQFVFVGFVLLKVVFLALFKKQRVAMWVSLGLGLMLFIMLRDLLTFWQAYKTPDRLPDSTMMQYGFGLLLLMVFIYLIKTFVDALNESERLNIDLELRVKQASQSLEQSYAENRVLEINESAQNERQKIYRDLHDDVGAKLVSIIHSGVENTQTDLAREALLSLREVVAQNNFQYQDSSVLMVSSVNEMELRLQNSNIGFSVSGAYDLPELPMASGVGYHVSRILREVTSNIIKHSQAKQVYLQCAINMGALSVRIRDDGQGMQGESFAGSGIYNIRYRAEEIGAEVEWVEVDDGGCGFRLKLQLEFKKPIERAIKSI